jgi:hypothetical protein
MMNLVVVILQIREQHTKYSIWGIIGHPSSKIPRNMFEVVIAAKGWGKPLPTDEMPLKPQVHIEPLEKWALDFIGPINPPSKGKQYILICTDYVTKWVEAKALVRATEQSVVNFLFEEIFVRFGVP